MAYTKLFSHIVTSSIWTEDDQTRILWITMLALSDKNGEIMASVPGLARVAGLSVDSTQRALDKFLSPDQYSRTPDEEGRRIEAIPGGWSLINHAKHRRMASVEETKEKNALRQKRFRDKTKRNESVTVSNDLSQQGNVGVTVQTDNAEADADTNAEADTKIPPNPQSSKPPKDNLPTTATAIRIANLFKRRLTTPWTDKEIKAFKKIGEVTTEDFDDIESYYEAERAKNGDSWARTTIATFLNNFPGELDRAKAFKANPRNRSTRLEPAKTVGLREGEHPTICKGND